ncbi:MAG: 50S ribosomal protein L25 [Bacteroidota bacterium]
MQAVAIDGQVRENLGKKATRATRREGVVPAVLYGTKDPIHFTLKPLSVRPLIYTAEFKVAELNIDGKQHRAIVKDVQFHPVSDAILHIDFLELEPKHPVKVAVPVTFIGSSPGVRGGGKLQQVMRRISIKTTPEHLVDNLVLSVDGLELGQSIRVRDLQVPEGVEVLNPPASPVAMVEIPRALRSAATAAAKEERMGGEGEEAPEEEA